MICTFSSPTQVLVCPVVIKHSEVHNIHPGNLQGSTHLLMYKECVPKELIKNSNVLTILKIKKKKMKTLKI